MNDGHSQHLQGPNTDSAINVVLESEWKIDTIARDLEAIKSLLQSPPVTQSQLKAGPSPAAKGDDQHDQQMIATHPWMDSSEPWQRSNTSKIVDVVRFVVRDLESGMVMADESSILSSLRSFLQVVASSPRKQTEPCNNGRRSSERDQVVLPSFEAAAIVLRWAKANSVAESQMGWMDYVLPQELFYEACQRVYFAIDEQDVVDLILANGYLTYLFAEYAAATPNEVSSHFGDLYQRNLQHAMFRLPLAIRPSLKLAAAQAFAAFHSIESRQVFMAWNFISAALNTCQTLGYHRSDGDSSTDPTVQDARSKLFWIVYRLERSLSLRLNRLSSIREGEITIPDHPVSVRHIKLGRIHGKIYEQLYCPAALTQPDAHTRGNAAKVLASELREMIQEMKGQLALVSSKNLTMKTRLLSDLICQSSTLTLILRAIAPLPGSLAAGMPNQCIATAREVLDMHEQWLATLRTCQSAASRFATYTSWNLVHVPFVPFIVLFHSAIQTCDLVDLTCLERFAASLRTQTESENSSPHTFQLYDVLYQTARLHVSRCSLNIQTAPSNLTMPVSNLPDVDCTQFGADSGMSPQSSMLFGTGPLDLGGWYNDNQYLMSLLDDNVTF